MFNVIFEWEGVQGWNRYKGHEISLLPLFLSLFSLLSILVFNLGCFIPLICIFFFPTKSKLYYKRWNGKIGNGGLDSIITILYFTWSRCRISFDAKHVLAAKCGFTSGVHNFVFYFCFIFLMGLCVLICFS